MTVTQLTSRDEEYPATNLAYDIAWKCLEQSDRSWTKVNDMFFKLMALSGPLALSVPVLARTFEDLKADNYSTIVIVGLVVNSIVCLAGRISWPTKEALDPMDIWQEYLTLDCQTFKRDITHEIGECYKHNAAKVSKKWKFVYLSVGILGIQTFAFVMWLL